MNKIQFKCGSCGSEYSADTREEMKDFKCEVCGGWVFEMKNLEVTAVRKEDDLYYNTVFWIVAPTIRDIMGNKKDETGKPKWKLVGSSFPVDYAGNYLNPINKNDLTHKRIWTKQYAEEYGEDDYTFYPRGRVNVNDGIAYINMNHKMNMPHLIDAIIEEAHVGKLELELDFNDTYQGSHYDYKLK